MTTVIILCYQFPPKHNTAAQRPHAWAKYFSDFGYYPIVITKDFSGENSEEISHEKRENYEVYRIKMKDTLQAQYWKLAKSNKTIKRRFISLLDKFFHTSLLFGPYQKSLEVAIEIIEKTPGDKILLTTAMPFASFNTAFEIYKRTGIKWVGDYRDDWTTTELPISSAIKRFLTPRIEKSKEIKWLSTASGFTSVSEHYVDKIGSLLKRKIPGACIENGFFEEEHADLPAHSKKLDLSFVYVGSMYPTQDIYPIVEGLKRATLSSSYDGKIKLVFLGTSFSQDRKKTLERLAQDSSLELSFIERLPKEDALVIQGSCHIAIIVPHTGLKGIPSSKLYEFIGARMPVLAYPSDNDIIHETLSRTGLGILPSDQADLDATLVDLLNKFQANQEVELSPNEEAISFYSRRDSTRRLAEFLDTLLA